MYFVYVLENENGLQYVGMTNDLARRLKEHKRGKTKTTKKFEHIKLIYKEKFDKKEDARKRELYLKTAAGRRFRKNINKMGA